MADTTQPSLLRRLSSSSEGGSWRFFFDRYWRLIYAYSRKCGLSPSDSEDVVQEVVLQLYQAMPGFQYDRMKGSFRAYLRTITHHKVVDRLRKESRESGPRTQSASKGNGHQPINDPASPDAEEIWERDWQRNVMLNSIDRARIEVDAKTFQAFQLYALEGWSVKETAKFLNMNRSSVYTAKSRVLERVKSWVDKELKRDQV